MHGAMVFLAIFGGIMGGLCILGSVFILIAESLGWMVRRYGATPMWRARKAMTRENRRFDPDSIVLWIA